MQAQSDQDGVSFEFTLQSCTETIQIDGLLEEAVWQKPPQVNNFWTNFPTDKKQATNQTKVWITHDDQQLYVAAICYDDPDYIVSTLKRDLSFDGSDVFAIFIDPLNQKTNGFGFGVTVMGSQSDALFSNDDADDNWDAKWYSAVSKTSEGWVVEIAIPFKSLRYEEGQLNWGVNFFRGDPGTNENSLWAKVPQQFPFFDLGYYGNMQWEKSPPKPGANMALIPYVTAGVNEDYGSGSDINYPLNAGLDFKLGLGSSLNLDVTVNPDFSQVEVDQQVTNLSRFSIFFPERRFFFLENADIFAAYGIPPVRPFFSRKIGLDENGKPIPIWLGLRLTGNLDPKTRIGLMSIQTGDNQQDDASQNYSVLSVQRQLFQRSVVKGYFHNRQGFHGGAFEQQDFGRNTGLEFLFSDAAGSKGAWGSANYGFTPEDYSKNHFYNWGAFFANENWNGFADFAIVGENYLTDFGFVERLDNYDSVRDTVIRLGYSQVYAELNYNLYPALGDRINFHNFHLETFLALNDDLSFNERSTRFAYSLNFQNTSSLQLVLRNFEVALPFPISFTDATPLPADKYLYNNFSLGYFGDQRKVFSYNAELEYGGFFNGWAARYSLGFLLRTQPWGNFGLDFNLNQVEFPANYGSAKLFLVGPRIEINFSNNIFWTTFLQYNTQANNLNINSRFQWRYAPMSDIYLVYTENYTVEGIFGPKNRALVLKVNYWLNL